MGSLFYGQLQQLIVLVAFVCVIKINCTAAVANSIGQRTKFC